MRLREYAAEASFRSVYAYAIVDRNAYLEIRWRVDGVSVGGVHYAPRYGDAVVKHHWSLNDLARRVVYEAYVKRKDEGEVIAWLTGRLVDAVGP